MNGRRRLAITALGGLAALGGCAGSDTPFLAPAPIADAGWLVVYRSGMGIGEADIAIDGAAPCALPGGSAFARQLKVGKHTVTADNPLAPGVSVLKVDLRAGQTAYVQVAANRGRIARSFIPVYGWVNSFVEAEHNKGKPHGNLFSLDQMTEQTAREDLAGTADIACSGRLKDQ